MRTFLNIVSVWNFRSVLMKLSRISIKFFTNILLGLRENFVKILGSFRVYFAKIIFRTPEENFEKVLCNRKNFKVISKNFWLNVEIRRNFWRNQKIFFRNREKIRKIYKMFGIVLKNFENITRNFEENFEKTKRKFWRNFLDQKMYYIYAHTQLPLCSKQGFTFAPTDRELLKPCLR